MQIKTTMAVIKMTRNSKCWKGCGEKGNPCALLVGMQTGEATMENSTDVPQKS